jgi:biopolymer transport protein ExbD
VKPALLVLALVACERADELARPPAPTPVPTPERVRTACGALEIGVDERGYSIDGERFAVAPLRATLEARARGFRAACRDEPTATIRALPSVTHGSVVALLDLLKAAGYGRISLLTS